MGHNLDSLFFSPSYWIEVAVLIVFIIVINMLYFIQNGPQGFIRSPIYILSEALERESHSGYDREQTAGRAADSSCPNELVDSDMEYNSDSDCDELPIECAYSQNCDSLGENRAEIAQVVIDSNGCTTANQILIRRHQRRKPLGGRVIVRSHCRHLPHRSLTKI